jgi:peptide/nickel transport system substrate-binding protein
MNFKLWGRTLALCLFVAAAVGASFEAAAQAAAPTKGGVLRVSFSGSPRLLDPPITGSLEEWVVTSWLYNNLTRVDSKLQVQPDLAESWTAANGGTEWTFKLAKGVKFHSGKEMTAEDVAYSINRILDPNTKSRGRGGIGPVTKIDVIDPYTVKFTLGKPIAEFPANLTLPYARIVPKDTKVNLNTAEDGTGPFILKEFVVGEKVVVERNPNYFRKGLPHVDAVQVQVYSDATAELNALKEGKTDIMWQVRPEQVKQLTGVPAVRVEQTPSGSFVAIVMRSDKPPFDNPLVRKALKLTLDRKQVVEAALSGQGTIGNDQSLPPTSPIYNSVVKAPARDVAQAKKLLAQAGHPNGVKVTLYTSDARVGMLPLALMTQQMARDAGFDINIQTVPWDVFLNTIWEKQNFYVNNWFARPTNDTSISPFFMTRDKGGSLNDYFYSNPEVDKILGEAQGELDAEKRKQLYGKAQALISAEGPAIIPFFKNNISAFRLSVQGFTVDPGINLTAEQIWLRR